MQSRWGLWEDICPSLDSTFGRGTSEQAPVRETASEDDEKIMNKDK